MFGYFSRCLTVFGLKRHQRRYVIMSTVLALFLFIYIIIDSTLISDSKTTVIVVLGGGLTSEGLVPAHTQLRLNAAQEIYNQLKGTAIIITLSGGTPHKPNPLDKRGFSIWESSAAATKLVEMGVPANHVYEENFSLDTLGNAYFLRTTHIDPGRYSKLVVVTNNWHMDRTKALFNYIFSLPSVDSFFSRRVSAGYAIEYVEVGAGIDDSHLLALRKEKESKSLQSFLQSTKDEFHSMKQLHTWLFTRHSAYATSRHRNNLNVEISAELLKTY